MKRIAPKSIGSLISLYEYKIFVQGIILKLYSFDQWGELGNSLANEIQQELGQNEMKNSYVSSTKEVIYFYRK